MLAVIDMGMGNLQSVVNAFHRMGAQVTVTTESHDIESASAVVLPGVGAFGDGMVSLQRKGLIEPLRRHVEEKKPLFGICLGMQLLAEEGEEHGVHRGLGFIRGRVVRLKPSDERYRVPNMGWCDVHIARRPTLLFSDLPDGESFYFAHSYHFQCSDPSDVTATIEYSGRPVTAAIEHGHLFGIQFHPEKSQDAGLQLLQSFYHYVQKNVPALRETG